MALRPVARLVTHRRSYSIGNDGITLCREAPATVSEGEIAVASKEELHAAPLSGKRLLARPAGGVIRSRWEWKPQLLARASHATTGGCRARAAPPTLCVDFVSSRQRTGS